jgi:hypothetical protein
MLWFYTANTLSDEWYRNELEVASLLFYKNVLLIPGRYLEVLKITSFKNIVVAGQC